MKNKNWIMPLLVAAMAICSLAGCSDDETSEPDVYNLSGSYWSGKTKVNIGSGLLNDNYPSQYAVTFVSDHSCIMRGSDSSTKYYYWKIPSTTLEKSYLPDGGVIITEYKNGGWKWLGEFEDEDHLALQHVLIGGVTVSLTREAEDDDGCIAL